MNLKISAIPRNLSLWKVEKGLNLAQDLKSFADTDYVSDSFVRIDLKSDVDSMFCWDLENTPVNLTKK